MQYHAVCSEVASHHQVVLVVKVSQSPSTTRCTKHRTFPESSAVAITSRVKKGLANPLSSRLMTTDSVVGLETGELGSWKDSALLGECCMQRHLECKFHLRRQVLQCSKNLTQSQG